MNSARTIIRILFSIFFCGYNRNVGMEFPLSRVSVGDFNHDWLPKLDFGMFFSGGVFVGIQRRRLFATVPSQI